MARTERFRRKDLRQPDEFLTLSQQALAYAQEHRTTVLMAAGALVVALGLVVGYRALRASRESNAAQAYGAAHAYLQQDKYPEAAQAFRAVADDYAGTAYGTLARLETANALLLAEKPGEAAVAYQQFLDAGPPTDYLRQSGLTRLGYAHEQSGKLGEALTSFEAAAAMSGPFTEDAQVGAARTAEESGDTAKATTLYQEFLDKHPTSERRALVMARLVALGASPVARGAEPGAPEPEG